MALQALAGYKDQKAVSQVIERALLLLSKAAALKRSHSRSCESSESTAQLIIALTSLGIDPETDSRFAKQDSKGNKKGLVTARFSDLQRRTEAFATLEAEMST